MPTRPHLCRPWAVGAVGALHVLVLMLWPDRPTGRDLVGPVQAPLVVQLLRAPTPAVPREPLPAVRSFSPSAPLWMPSVVTMPTARQADPLPTVVPTEADPPSPDPSTAPSLPSPLDLRLPPPGQRPPTRPRPLDAPRPRSIESRLAQDLASTPLREEALGDGRLRLRQGHRCVDLRDARMAQIDPFNQSVSPIPKQAEDCAR